MIILTGTRCKISLIILGMGSRKIWNFLMAFAIKRLNPPSWQKFHSFLLHFFSFAVELQSVFWGSCPLLESSSFRRKHPFCLRSTNLTPDLHFPKILTAMQDFWVRARVHPNNSIIFTSLASL